MGLLGKLFGGGKKKDQSASGRSKRGRAPSIRQIPEDALSEAPAEAPLPEINLDEIDAQPVAPSAPVAAEGLDPIPVDFQAPEAPAAPAVSPPPQTAVPSRPASTRKPAGPATPAAPRATRRSTRLQSRQKPLGEILIQAEAVSTEQLSRALKIQDKGGKGFVGQILVNMGACPATAISAALGRQFRISTVELDRIEIPADTAALITDDKCREHRLIPFEKLGKMLCLAMANCLNRKAINEIEELTKLKVKPFNCSWIEIRDAIEKIYTPDLVQKAAAAQTQAVAEDLAAEAPELEGIAPAPAAGEEVEEEEARPFTGPSRAVIEGLEGLEAGEAEVVKTTDRGLASKHLEARQARREERQKAMGTGKGVVGKLIVPDLDKFSADQTEEAPEVIDLRVVEESELRGVELPVAEELAASVGEFAEKVASPAPVEEAAAPVEEAPLPEFPAAAEEEVPEFELIEMLPAHGGDADHDSEPQSAAVAAAEVVAEDLPAVPAIEHVPEEIKEAAAVPITDAEWTRMEADLELDPVVAWEATYAAEGPVPVRESPV